MTGDDPVVRELRAPLMCKASGKSPCARCGKPMQRGEMAARREEGVVHVRCDDMLTSAAAAAVLGISVGQFRRLASALNVEPDATKKNPVYRTAAPMALWYKATIVERFRSAVALSRDLDA